MIETYNMKFVFTIVTLLISLATALPLASNRVSSHDDLNHNQYASAEVNWHILPDDNGKMHLIDLNNGLLEIDGRFDALNDIIFRLFTRNNPSTAQAINIYNNDQLTSSNFNPAHQTRFHIHGWNGGGANTGSSIRNAFIQRGDFNVFTVDWSVGAVTPNIAIARGHINAVGQVVAQFIDWLTTHGLRFEMVSVIGHSLGAHAAGATGKRTTRGKLASIVGLDPAISFFSIDDPQNRLHYNDATYVEAIFTDVGQSAFELPLGHANYYPNWGTSQPGCGIDINGLCSHVIVNEFYAESINSNNIFDATRCRDFNDIRTRNCVRSGTNRRMGGEPVHDGPSEPNSVFFLTTQPTRPFALGPR